MPRVYCACRFHGRGGFTMSLTIEAIYENGVLKPVQPLPLAEHARVQITVKPATSRVRQTAGLMGWTGSEEDLRRLIEDPEFSIMEAYDHAELERCVEALRK